MGQDDERISEVLQTDLHTLREKRKEKMHIIKRELTWILCNAKGEWLDSFDTRAEAENALWDYEKGWESLWDVENRRNFESLREKSNA